MLKLVNTEINKRFVLIRNIGVRKVQFAVMDVLMQWKTLDWYHPSPQIRPGVPPLLWCHCLKQSRWSTCEDWHNIDVVRLAIYLKYFGAKRNYFEANYYVALMFMIKWLQSKRIFKGCNRSFGRFHVCFIITWTTSGWLNFKEKKNWRLYPWLGVQSADIWSHALSVCSCYCMPIGSSPLASAPHGVNKQQSVVCLQ